MNNVNNALSLFESMSFLELNEFILAIEKKYNLNQDVNFNVDKNLDNNIEKKYSLFLKEIGSNKISIIKIIREVNNLGLKEAKTLVESCPVLLKESLDLNVIEDLKKKLESFNAKTEIKS